MNLLDRIKTGPTLEPLRLLLHGQEGVGKTTWAAGCPDALFLSAEDGGGDLEYTRIVLPTWAELRNAIRDLLNDSGSFRTVVIDTIDSFERLLWQQICEDAEVDSIEKVGGGYGKGYTAAAEAMAALQKDLDTLRAKRRVHVILLAHSHVRPFNDPLGAPYDRYEVRMHKGTADLWKGWADAILFACFDVTVMKAGKKGRVVEAGALEKGKAIDGAKRVIYTSKEAAYDAKNRHNLPDEIALAWGAFAKAIKWDERDQAIRGTKPPPEVSDWRSFRCAADAPHDASFNDEARTAFMGWLHKRGLDYEQVKAWTASLGCGKPSQWPSALRKKLAADLDNGARKEFDAWATGQAAAK